MFFRDVLRWPQVDVGGGWLIFGMPGSVMCTSWPHGAS